MLRITLQNAFGDTLHDIRDKMIRKSVKKNGRPPLTFGTQMMVTFVVRGDKIIFCKESELYSTRFLPRQFSFDKNVQDSKF